MPYVKIDDGIFRNPKVMRVASAAKFVYVASICYSGSSLTDGFIPASAVRVLASEVGVAYSPKIAQQLVSSGLWIEVAGGFQVYDYLGHNESAEKVQAKKEAARDRMNRRRSTDVRANNEGTSREVREPDTTTDTTTTVSQLVEKTDTPKPPRETKPKTSDLSTVQQERFDRWYAVYPRKVGPAEARKAWSKIAPSDEFVDRMIAKVREWTDSEEWTAEGGKYIPHPSTWLNSGRWDDGAPSVRAANVTRIGGAANGRASPGKSLAEQELVMIEREEARRGRTA